jgi:hypothetical protein
MSGVNRLGPSIDCFEADFLVLGPNTGLSPTQAIKATLLDCGIAPNREQLPGSAQCSANQTRIMNTSAFIWFAQLFTEPS